MRRGTATVILLLWSAAALPPLFAAQKESGGTAAALQSAQRAVAEKRFAEAREIYSRLAAAQPQNIEHWIWMGRLSLWLNDGDRAVAAFARALELDPRNAEALAGKAMTLMREGRNQEAEPLLLDAAARAPADLDIQLLLARNDLALGKRRSAEQRAWRILATNPAYQEARDLLIDRSEPRPRIRTKLGYQREDFSYLPDSAHTSIVIVHVDSDPNRYVLHVEYWDKFGEQVGRGGGSYTRKSGPYFFSVGTLLAPDAEVVARQEYAASAARAWGSVSLELGARHMSFSTAKATILSPVVEYYFPRDRGVARLGYARSFTEFDGATDRVEDDSYLARVLYYPVRRVGLTAGYSTGSESFVTLSADRLGQLDADSYFAGIDLELGERYVVSGVVTQLDLSNQREVRLYNLFLTIRP